MQLGTFMMPMHDPDRDFQTVLQEDLESVVLADRLGYAEAWCGEHFTSLSEPISSPLIFLATLIRETRQIKFGTAVINLPQLHPAAVAAHVSLFDHLAKGRLLFGIGPGGLVSDIEMFEMPAPAERPQMMLEAIDMIVKLWTSDPPYEIPGKYWQISLKDNIWPRFKVGHMVKPYQRPHPPIALSLVTPNSASAKLAGQKGWIPISGNFFHQRYLKGHWEMYAAGCEAAGRQPDPAIWRVSRSVLVGDSEAEVEDYLADTGNGLSYYYTYFVNSFQQRQALHMIKPDLAMADAAVSMDNVKRGLTIAGNVDRVSEQLVALIEETGPFGTLLLAGHDWDNKALWRRSMELMAEQVVPRLGDKAAVRRAGE